MAQDEFIDKKITDWEKTFQNIAKGEGPIGLRDALRQFAKQIEKETRHKAAELAQMLSKDIMNL